MARSFNGSTSHINIGGVIIASPMTIAAWINLTNTSFIGAIINGNTNNNAVEFRVNAGALSLLRQNVAAQVSGGSLSAGVWTAVAATNTGTAQALYIAGASVATGTDSTGYAGDTYLIGGASGLVGDPFNGNIADFAVWTVVLSVAEISALSKGARPHQIRPNSLLRYFPLDGLQSPEPDLSGSGTSGTLTGTALVPGPPVAMFTPRRPQFIPGAVATGSAVFRRSLSPIGTRVGTRQAVI